MHRTLLPRLKRTLSLLLEVQQHHLLALCIRRRQLLRLVAAREGRGRRRRSLS